MEILSPDDVALELRMKVAEYLRFGVRFVWVVDPVSFTGDAHTAERVGLVPEGLFRAEQLEVDVRKI